MNTPRTPAQNYQKYLPWGVVALGALYLAYCAMPPRRTTEFELDRVGAIPVYYNGRLQPLDSVARNTLMIISGRQTFEEELADGRTRRHPAIEWLMDVWAYGTHGRAAEAKIFRIENDQVLASLGLKQRSGLRYSVAELQDRISILTHLAIMARKKDAKSRDLTDEKVLELERHVGLFVDIAQRKMFIPSDKTGDAMFTVGHAVEQQVRFEYNGDGVQNWWGEKYLHLEAAYSQNDAKEFNKLAALVQDKLQETMPAQLRKTSFETFFNRSAPFYNCILLYIFVFLLACLSWLDWSKPLSQSAFALCILTFIVHTGVLIARMYLMDRWGVFVTNLYSSAIFIGWGCVGLGLVLEYLFHNGIGCVVGSVTGALSLIIAHFLSLSGDTMEMLQAVLDTNFWLATHVTCITFGYTATFVAGFLGIGYVLVGLFGPNLSRDVFQTLTRMIYGVVCFATLLSFTGTVLGGIWADESWGRFWGWDPKENGALLIVLMNALVLHARWGGMVKARGMVVLTILGNIVVAWSWFGVNMLGVGLHSYGFTSGTLLWMLLFVGSQLGLAVLGMFDPASVRAAVSSFVNSMGAPPAKQSAAN